MTGKKSLGDFWVSLADSKIISLTENPLAKHQVGTDRAGAAIAAEMIWRRLME
jgi:hypothetical protein